MSDIFLPGDQFSTFEEQDKVLVGMSGGVDSAVCVHILRQQGFAVTGAVFRFSDAHNPAVAAAQKAATALGVPLEIIDCGEEFETHVVGPFCEEYCSGRTPNPCVLCNPAVKMKVLAQRADELGIRLIATGHYARVEETKPGIYQLCRASSISRDQSYMLHRLDQSILARLCLPLGDFDKEDIREIARDLKLPCAEAPDSMEICFIPDGDYAAYISQKGYEGKAGHFIGPDGEDLGPHQGVLHYTLGQRKGLGLALGKPAFIKAIRENGDVVLGWSGEEFFSGMKLTGIVTPDGSQLPAGSYQVKVRSAAQPEACYFDGVDTVTFEKPARAPAPGQSAVFYQGDVVEGGGLICESID